MARFTTLPRLIAALPAAALLFCGPLAAAEAVKGPVHIQGNAQFQGEDEARSGLAEARAGIADAERGLDDTAADLARMEAGDFSGAMTIENGKVVKCGDPSRYPGCVPYTAAEKAQMLVQVRHDLAEARSDLAQSRRDLAQAERELGASRD